MCEAPAGRGTGWHGWLDIPAPSLSSSTADWVDLSHALSEKLERIHFLPPPRIERIASLPDAVANITEIQMVVHFGTHVDAPLHFITDGPAMDEVPLDRLWGGGVLLRLDPEPLSEITVEQLKAAGPEVQRGDIVLLDTGWSRHTGTDMYEQHPALSTKAAEWLVERGAKLLAVDFSTPDLTAHRRPDGFEFPVHHTLLSQGILIAEHLTNMEALSSGRVDVFVMALNIAASDGAQARIIARPADTSLETL